MVEDRAKDIKLIMLDIDGVMTDGKIYYGNYGDELKAFDVKDGLGLALCKKAGIEVALITAKKSRIARLRAKDMSVKMVYENTSKLKVFKSLIKKLNIKPGETCFMGDDLLDLPVLKQVGLPIAVPGAVDEVKSAAHYITKAKAGSGAVREICELILKSQGKWEGLIQQI